MSPHSFNARHGGTAQVVIITIVVVFVAFLLACAGLGVAGYFWFQRMFGQALVVEAAEIEKITGEMAQLTMPPQFTPYRGSRLFGMTDVAYKWCPEGNCPTIAPELNLEQDQEIPVASDDYDLKLLTLSSFESDDDEAKPIEEPFNTDDFTDEALSRRFRTFEKDIFERKIRGKDCKFFVVKGEEHPLDWEADDFEDGAEPEMPSDHGQTPTTTDPENQLPPNSDSAADIPDISATDSESAAIDASKIVEIVAATGVQSGTENIAATIEARQPGRKIVWIAGAFPGKTAEVRLNFQVKPEDYDAGVIRQLIDSIR